jgi:hypothetical protein
MTIFSTTFRLRSVGGLVAALSALAVAAAPLPAFAAPAESRTAPAAAPAEQSGGGAKTKSHAVKYCVVDKLTGSRIAKKTCKTKEEWARDGIDITAL